MTHSIVLRAAAPAALLALPAAAFAADLRVGAGQAYETIQAAVDAASPGDRILVGPGVYAEYLIIGTERLSLVGDDAIIDDPGGSRRSSAMVDIDASQVALQGFRFRAGADGVYGWGDGLRVTDCSFVGLGGFAVRLSGAGNRVERCEVRACGGSETVSLTGDDALVRKVNVFQSTGRGLYMISTRGRITACRVEVTAARGIDADVPQGSVDRCRVVQAGDFGILASGEGARVERNEVEDGLLGIQVAGFGVVVQRNSVSGTDGRGITVFGEGVLVASNKVTVTADDADGIQVSSGDSKGAARGDPVTPGRVTKNVVTEAVAHGFLLTLRGSVVSMNRAIRCGSEEESGFEIRTSNGQFSRNEAVDCYSIGFDVSGDGNTFAGDRATGAAIHGFRMGHGSRNVFRGCSASGCDGQGFYNEGTETSVLGGTFLGNRMDVANIGSFEEFRARYVTGGPEEPPLVR